MRLGDLSGEAQAGIRQWARDFSGTDRGIENAGGPTWAWLCQLLRESDDRVEWFPRGKWATLQFIEDRLRIEAQAAIFSIFGPVGKL